MGRIIGCLRGTLLCLRTNWPVCLLTLLAVLPSHTIAGGTNRNIQAIFLGRCWEYQSYINPAPFQNGLKNCTKLWELFHNSFSFRGSCSVSTAEYSSFSEEADHYIPDNTQLFWSGVYQFVRRYANTDKLRFYSIENTLSGYLLSNLVWCGSETSEGINYTQCPGWDDCQTSAVRSFWDAASLKFSQKAKGTIYLMLNGSRQEAVRQDSTFARVELPEIQSDRVKRLRVILVHHLDHIVVETCSNGSILELKKLIESRGILYECQENPPDVRFLMCADNPKLKGCSNLYTTDGCSSANSISSLFQSWTLMCALLLLSQITRPCPYCIL